MHANQRVTWYTEITRKAVLDTVWEIFAVTTNDQRCYIFVIACHVSQTHKMLATVIGTLICVTICDREKVKHNILSLMQSVHTHGKWGVAMKSHRKWIGFIEDEMTSQNITWLHRKWNDITDHETSSQNMKWLHRKINDFTDHEMSS